MADRSQGWQWLRGWCFGPGFGRGFGRSFGRSFATGAGCGLFVGFFEGFFVGFFERRLVSLNVLQARWQLHLALNDEILQGDFQRRHEGLVTGFLAADGAQQRFP